MHERADGWADEEEAAERNGGREGVLMEEETYERSTCLQGSKGQERSYQSFH